MINVPGLNITGPLGKGGTAAVSKAFSSRLNKEVAAKYPLSDIQGSINQFAKLAEREYQLAGILRFPGIVNILEHSEHPPYLILELCKGQSLDKFGRIDDPLMLMVITSTIAANLEFLRLNQIIHGDLKPHNIFLPSDFPYYESDELFFAKISDFSLGRFESEPETVRAGHGTVGYAAPEISIQEKTSHKTDLFALGVIGYQLATGIHPFSHGETDPLKIQSRVREEIPAPLQNFRKDLPKEFINLIISLISKNENERPETAWNVCRTLAGCGCKYPYEKVITPSFLLRTHKDYKTFVDRFLQITDKQEEQLTDYTESKTDYLRLLLSSNFKRGNLRYSNGRFSFGSSVYWPSYLRRRPLIFFTRANWKQKRLILESAVERRRKADSEAPPGAKVLFTHFLSPSFVKRLSAKIVEERESQYDLVKTARLYLQAGILNSAISCADKATARFKESRQRVDGIHLINHIIEYSELLNQGFEARQLLMTKGDLQRSGGDADGAFDTYNHIVKLYTGHPSDQLLAETYRKLGDLHKVKQRFDKGIEVLNQALSICRELKDDLLISKVLSNIGELYRIASDLANSLKFVRQALAIQKRLGAVSDAASSLNSMAIIYGTKGKLKRAITLLAISLKMKRTLDDQLEIARTLNNLGYAHQLSGDSSQAQFYLKESLAINRKMGNNKEVLSNLWNLSEIVFKNGQIQEALAYVKEGLEIAIALNLKPHQAHFLRSMGCIYQRMDRFGEAENCYAKTSSLVNEIDDRVLKVRLLLSQSDLRYELGDSKTAVALAEHALAEAVSIKAGLEEFQALQILVKISGKPEHLNRARNLAQELKLDREKLLIEFAYLQFLLDIDAKSDLKRLYEPLELKLTGMLDDIEYPGQLNIAGEILISCGEKKRANSLLSEALKLAQSKNLTSDEICARILSGRVSFDTGDFEKAYGNYREALRLCKQAATSIASDEDKLTYMKKPKMLFLASQIRRLSEKIGAKQKAGV